MLLSAPYVAYKEYVSVTSMKNILKTVDKSLKMAII